MADVLDVAQYVLERQGAMSAIKLQKLIYYCQAWSLVWTESPLFHNSMEAWASGPVSPELAAAHGSAFNLEAAQGLGDSSHLTEDQRDVIDNVLKGYGDKSAQWLVELTRLEAPWREARGCTPPGQRCGNEISLAAMAEYYAGL